MVNVSIVLYNPDWQELNALVRTLLRAKSVGQIYLVDNSPKPAADQVIADSRITYLHNGGLNLGYGAAHNIAIRDSIFSHTPLHLVINSDIIVQPEDIDYLHDFMMHNPTVGSLMPHVTYPNSETQYLCKLLPTPWDVFGRRFLPRRWMERRNRRYTLRDSGYDRMLNVPYLSGCFMLLRTEAVHRAGLFDERFFMYPEDIDLTRRIHRDYLTLYLPDVTIIHNHAQSSYKSLRMLWVHIINMCRYFNKWGWLYDPERRLFNRLTLAQLR